MRITRRLILPALFLFAIGIFAGARLGGFTRGADSLEQLRKLEDAFMLIDRQYVEEVNAEDVVEGAIQAMLKELDPHSSYISKDIANRVQEGYRGSFGGIGIWFEAPPEDTARVTSVIPDGPSEQVGLMAGDLIIAVEDSSVVGLISTDIQDRIRGEIGTPVRLTVRRFGIREPFDITIIRGQIPLYSIDGSYMIDERTGFIRISRFALTTHDEFKEHVARLKALGMERLVLDLRDNPGGIKQTAVMVADEFLGPERTIVFTKSRNANEEETDISTAGGGLETGAVIVLVNENTASGSEIISGALQDHDRALIVGRRTFGKGLVQRPFRLRDGSILQLTVSRYYMPSGRLIQTPYESGDMKAYFEQKFDDMQQATYSPAEYLHDIADSLRFTTAHGRPVFGGGGVMPDVVVAPDTMATINAPIMRAVIGRGLDVRYAREWFLGREQEFRSTWTDRRDDFIADFAVDQAFMDGFWSFAAENGVEVSDLPVAETDSSSTVRFETVDAELIAPLLRTVLKARVAQRMFRSEAWFPIFNPIDPIVTAALRLWDQAEDLAVNGRISGDDVPDGGKGRE